jgi:hypothetical protein
MQIYNSAMKKKDAIAIFGTGAALGRALSLTRGAVHNWADTLTQRQSDEIIGAALRLKVLTPEKAEELLNDERQRIKRSSDQPYGSGD